MAKCRLLVIEDDDEISNLVCRVGEEADFDVRAARGVDEIPVLYAEFLPEIVVLDIVMPQMDGMEVLNFLHKRNSASRIVILSGQPSYRPMALALGDGLGLSIDATIAKPFRIAELRQVLEKIRISIWAGKENQSLHTEPAPQAMP